ncbi:hypothetical protein BO219_13335 [Anoxybacillus kestanbolensis]|uniref:Uncharacterized protein n=1 Tax=Anoxybacillus kestanbolensis TaxID=227476 RepID=A0A1V3FF47_9BACL|nr:hypothetical protein BO219_13335 [Anoxybacillus kestanbolensis]
MNFRLLFLRETAEKRRKNQKIGLKIKKSKFYIIFVFLYHIDRGGDKKQFLSTSFQNVSSYCSLTVWLASSPLASFFQLTGYGGSGMLGVKMKGVNETWKAKCYKQ